MSMKLITTDQIAALRSGDILTRFPYNKEPETIFDVTRKDDIQYYRVCSVNIANGMLELVATEASQDIFGSPGKTGRLFIKSVLLAPQKKWWVDDATK